MCVWGGGGVESHWDEKVLLLSVVVCMCVYVYVGGGGDRIPLG